MPAAPLAPRFATRATRWLVVVTLASLAASLWLLVSPGELSPHDSVEADGYSGSALGHRGLLAWLRANGEVVMQSRRQQGPGKCGLFVLAEPGEMSARDVQRLQPAVERAPSKLFVLPKRRGWRDAERPDWVERVELRELADVQRTFADLGKCADLRVPHVVRRDATTNWNLPPGWPEPRVDGPAQLLDGNNGSVTSIIACDEGVLLGRIGGVYVLADPDLIANHGLLRGDNAALVLAMVRSMKADGAIVFDETLHGYHLAASIWHAAGQFPFVLVTAQLLLLLALAAWIARGRFGPVQPEAPPIGAGKAFLIDNVAALLRRAGGTGPSLRRYARQRLRRAADALRAPRGLDDEACRAFVLARLPAAARDELAALLARTKNANAADVVATARRLRSLTEGSLHARS
jgi:hypothetical protein